MSKINKQALNEELLLLYLKDKGCVKRKDFGKIFQDADQQTVKNIVSNESNKTSPIAKGYIEHNRDKDTFCITKEGEEYLEKKFPPEKRRS